MNKSTVDIYANLVNRIVSRYRLNHNKSMLDVYQLHQDFLKSDPESVEFLYVYRDEVLKILQDPHLESELLDLFVNEALQFTYQNNQFIQLDSQQSEAFRALYLFYLRQIRRVIQKNTTLDHLASEIGVVINDHFAQLQAYLSKYYTGEIPVLYENQIFKKNVCAEYSPEFQCKLLGLEPASLPGPVLDMGCGKNGNLVKYLISRGIDAAGVDRFVEPDGPLIESDWFEFELVPNTWGTVISHMAVSNHFIFHHRYQSGQPEKYAGLFMNLLVSLKKGGAFYYAPGLPFFEKLLPPAHFSIQKTYLNTSTYPASQQDPGGLWYAAKVTKI